MFISDIDVCWVSVYAVLFTSLRYLSRYLYELKLKFFFHFCFTQNLYRIISWLRQGFTKKEAGMLVAISAALDLVGRLGFGYLCDLQIFDRKKAFVVWYVQCVYFLLFKTTKNSNAFFSHAFAIFSSFSLIFEFPTAF